MTPAGAHFEIKIDGVVRTLRDRLIIVVATFAMLTPSLALAQPKATAAANGGGYELHFENVPVATLAKVILGDILGVGYTIDPRVQGTVSLASSRPVPKSDILFVLENALSLSNIALVPDVLGYRLMPVGEAIGTGQVDVRR